MKINHYQVFTGMGRGGNSWKKIPFLSDEDIKTLDAIGYGSDKRFTRTEYLNQTYEGKYMFDIIQTGYDGGDFAETFLVIVVEL